MKLPRFLKFLLVFALLFCIFIIISGFIVFQARNDFVRFLPGDGRIDLMLEVVIALVASSVLSIIVPRGFAPLLLRFLKNRRKKTTYVHLPTSEAKHPRNLLGRATLPVLLTFSIANLLTIYVPAQVIYAEVIPQYTAAFNLGLLLIPVIMFIALLIWTLEDQGIASWKPSPERSVPVLEGVGRSISSFLRGYAGISALITYVELTVQNFIEAPTLTWTSYLQVLGPVIALVGYFMFWVITTVIYERVTVLNDQPLLARFGVAEYQAFIEPKAPSG